MRLMLKLSVAIVPAVLLSICLTIALDLELYFGLADRLGNRKVADLIDYLDGTEIPRAVAFFTILMLWTLFLLGVNRGIDRFRRGEAPPHERVAEARRVSRLKPAGGERSGSLATPR